MLGIAKFAMRNAVSAATVAAALLLISILSMVALGGFGSFISFMGAIGSSAVIALALLRHGYGSGSRTAVIGLVIIGLFSALIGIPVTHMVMLVAMIWLPVFLAALVLRETVSLAMAIHVVGGIMAAGVLLTYVIMGDPAVVWLEMLQRWLETMLKMFEESGAPAISDKQIADYRRFVDVMAQVMTGAIAASLLCISVLALLLARSWQARLFNPGGFQPEFHGLRLGKAPALASVIVCAAALATGAPILTSLATVAMVIFLFQGLAVIHALVKERGMNKGWLIGVYAMLLLIQTTILLGALGMADNWLNLRKT